MASLSPDIRRVLVALSGAEDERVLIETAIDLAAKLQAELATLFIEDADLLRASMLPCVREIGRLSAQTRQLESASLQRRLKAAASEAELRLRQTAEARALRYTFQVLRGRLLPRLFEASEQWDVMLLSPSMRPMRQQARNRPIAVYYDASAAAERALVMAAGLARGTGSPLHLLIPAADEATFHRNMARARGHAGDLVIAGERVAGIEELARQANGLAASVLIVHDANAFDLAELGRLLGRLNCDLLVLR